MPTRDETIGFEHKGIGAVLSHNRLAVPLNQREYSWEQEHVEDLFSDFASAIADNRSTYFLGTIVLTRGTGDIPEVSDGQQRLATTTILLCAIRDYFKKAKDYKRAESIEQDFLKTTDLETTETVPKLKLNVDDNEFFKKYVIECDRPTSPLRESHKHIKAAAFVAERHLKEILAPYKEETKTTRLLEWVKFIRDGAEVILLRVPDHLNAFVMFETLNDRGLKASQADLLKNYLLSYCGDSISEGQQKWAHMQGVLESLGRGDMTVTYLHHMLITRLGPTKEREVYDKVKHMVSSQGRALEWLDDVADRSHNYAALFNSDHSKWNEYGTATRKNIATINRDLRVDQIRPLMFAVANHFSVSEAQLAFRLFVFWSVRFLIVGGRGGLLDRNYSMRAEEVASGAIRTASGLSDKMSDVVPGDGLFESSFASQRVSKAHQARYYLRALERKVKDDPEPEFVPSDEEHTINLEHVLPENPEQNYPYFDLTTAPVYYKRIGNMVILQAKQNVLAGNAPFHEKKKVFEPSAFLLTSQVAKFENWGPSEIEERQRTLAKLAVETWPLRVD